MVSRFLSLLLAPLLALGAGPVVAEPLRIVAFGDMPYGDPAEVYPPFEALIGAINARDPDLVIHVGDTKSSATPCTDRALDDQLGYLGAFEAPTLYTPGDNEWTDCHFEQGGGFAPLERLARIRTTYFADPAASFGQNPVPLVTQAAAGYPENAFVQMGRIAVIAVHVVGSNNNFEIRDPAAVAEFFARDAAGLAWLEQGFERARDAEVAGVVVAMHADMFEAGFRRHAEAWVRHSGFGRIGEALKAQAAVFGKPVLLVFGDSHVFGVSQPFPRAAPNVTALEVFGGAHMHAVEIAADPDRPGVFAISVMRNPAL